MDEPAWKYQDKLLPQPFNRPFWVDYLAVKVFLGLIVLNLLGLNILLVQQAFRKASPQPKTQPEVAVAEATPSGEVGQMREDLAVLQASLSAQLAACIDTRAVTSKARGTAVTKQKSYEPKLDTIAFPGARGTNETTWWDVPNMEVAVNGASYPGHTAYWEALMKIKDGGGKAYARIWDITAGIPVPGSEISTSSKTLVRISSGSISFWPAHRTYRVQIKSQLGAEAAIEDAKIKISWLKEQ